MNTSLMFSSETDMWETPQDLFDRLNAVHHFDLDVCAVPENAKCVRYFTPEVDGLKQDWNGTCWMNPPYGREIGKWVRKAYESVSGGGVQWSVSFRHEQTRHGSTITSFLMLTSSSYAAG